MQTSGVLPLLSHALHNTVYLTFVSPLGMIVGDDIHTSTINLIYFNELYSDHTKSTLKCGFYRKKNWNVYKKDYF